MSWPGCWRRGSTRTGGELRFEAFTSPVVRKAIAQLAERMRDVFWRPPAAASARPARKGQAVSTPEPAAQAGTPDRVTDKTEPPTHVVDITQGRLDLEGCDISSRNGACNQIHDGKESGVYVYDDGRGTLEDNDITGNAPAGVAIKSGGDPTLRGNRINRNEYEGVWIYKGGRGTVEDNDLTGNVRGAWDIAEDCRDNVTRARNKE